MKGEDAMKGNWISIMVMASVMLLVLAACSLSTAAPLSKNSEPSVNSTRYVSSSIETSAKSPEVVLRAIIDALNNKDAEKASAFLADDVTQALIPAPSGTGVYQGKDAMHARFTEVVAANPVHKLVSCQSSGDRVTCSATYSDDTTRPLGFDLGMTVDAWVQNGLLKVAIWKMTPETLAKVQAAMAAAQAKSPEAVLRAIIDALNNKDVDKATGFLADDVTQTLIPAPSGTGLYQGKEAMSARFSEVVAANPVHKLLSCQTSGDRVSCSATYSDDTTRPLGFDLGMTVDATVQNGLLKEVTWKMTPETLAKVQAAMAAAQPKTTPAP
jgi:hypothetical protein